MPVTRKYTAAIEPIGLKRPGMIVVAPRKAAAKAGRRKLSCRSRVGRAERSCIEHARERADQARRPRTHPSAGGPRGCRSGARPATPSHEQQPPASGHELEDVEQQQAQGDAVNELKRDPEEPVDDDGRLIGWLEMPLIVWELLIQRTTPAMKVERPKRRDQRVDLQAGRRGRR